MGVGGGGGGGGGGGHQEEGQCTPTAKTPYECMAGPLNVRLWPRSK